MVLGAGRVVGRRRMSECMTEPERYGPVSNLIPVPNAKGVKDMACTSYWYENGFVGTTSLHS